LTNAGPSLNGWSNWSGELDRADAKKKQAIIRKIYTGRRIKWVAAASLFVLLAGGGYCEFASGRVCSGFFQSCRSSSHRFLYLGWRSAAVFAG